jgi:hypothetical protein
MYTTRFAPRRAQAVDYKKLARRLWGDYWLDRATGKFVTSPPAPVPAEGDEEDEAPPMPRAFVHFVLEPLYKIYSQVRG